MLHGAVDVHFVEFSFQLVAQLVAKISHALRLFRHFRLAYGASFTESHDSGDVQSAGTHATLVAAAIHLRGNLNAGALAANVQRADALGPVKFVAAERHQIDVVFDDVDRNLAAGLSAVRVYQHTLRFRNLSDFRLVL